MNLKGFVTKLFLTLTLETHCLRYKKLNLFVNAFAINSQLFQITPSGKKFWHVYHMNDTFQNNFFDTCHFAFKTSFSNTSKEAKLRMLISNLFHSIFVDRKKSWRYLHFKKKLEWYYSDLILSCTLCHKKGFSQATFWFFKIL